MLEQLLGGKVDARLACPAHDLNRDDRITAQLKEVVLTPDLLALEHVLPDLRDALLQLALGRAESAAYVHGIGQWQGFAIQFAVGHQRQRRQQHDLVRHHVGRQHLGELRLDTLGQTAGVGAMGDHIGHQLRALCHLLGQYHSLTNGL